MLTGNTITRIVVCSRDMALNEFNNHNSQDNGCTVGEGGGGRGPIKWYFEVGVSRKIKGNWST